MESPPILELMTQQAGAEREALLSDASAKAAGIREEAQVRCDTRRDAALAELDAELEMLGSRSRERAEAAAEMVVKTTRDTIADEVLASAEKALEAVAQSDDFPAILEALLAEAFNGIQDASNVVVLSPPAHVERCKAWLAGNGHEGLQVEAFPALKDGVAIQDPSRSFRVTNTLSARFARREGALRKLCINRLFGGE